MNPILEKLLGQEKSVATEFDYHDPTLQKPTQDYFNVALANKAKAIPLEATIQQAMLAEDGTELEIRSKHWLPIHEDSEKIEHKMNKLKDIRERYSEYVESEKEILLDKYFEKIDLLEAKLRKLEAQAEEQEQILSQSNDKDDEAQSER